MNTHHLVKMANEIGRFFEAYPDRTEARDAIASHLKRFWDPRMRREIRAHLDATEGVDLLPLVAEAVATLEVGSAARP